MCVLLCKKYNISPFEGVVEDTLNDETGDVCLLEDSCISALHAVMLSFTCNNNNIIK